MRIAELNLHLFIKILVSSAEIIGILSSLTARQEIKKPTPLNTCFHNTLDNDALIQFENSVISANVRFRSPHRISIE